MAEKIYKLTEVASVQEYQHGNLPWPKGMFKSIMDKNYNEQSTCKTCGGLMVKHASMMINRRPIIVCPGSYIIYEFGNGVPFIVSPEQYRAHYRKIDLGD